MNKSEWLNMFVIVACLFNIVEAVIEKRFHDAFMISMLACIYGKKINRLP